MKAKLKEQLKLYIEEFEEKHGLEFDHAVGDDLLGVISFGNTMFFNMSDIIQDIDSQYDKGLIIQWHEDTVENYPKFINLSSYAMGLRYKTIKNKKP